MGLAYLHGIDLGWLTWGWLTWSQLIGIYASPMESRVWEEDPRRSELERSYFLGEGGQGL